MFTFYYSVKISRVDFCSVALFLFMSILSTHNTQFTCTCCYWYYHAYQLHIRNTTYWHVIVSPICTCRHILFTAIHSLISSPSGSWTAILMLPLPRVAEEYFSNSCAWLPSGIFLHFTVLLDLLRIRYIYYSVIGICLFGNNTTIYHQIYEHMNNRLTG